MLQHEITFQDACNLVCNFLNDANLRGIGQNNAMGGHISVANFYKPVTLTPYGGTLNWYCWKDGTVPEFFLATEKGVAYDSQHLPQAPISATLYRNQPFTYSGAIDQASVAAHITGHTLAVNADTPISRAEVIAVSGNNFINNFPGNMPGNAYLDFAIAFFQDNDSSIRNFLAQAPAAQYLRYYFGMSIINGVNGLKVIFIPVDANGRNITTQGGVGLTLLERNWPPRP